MAQPPQAPKKKSWFKRILLVLALLVLFLSALGVGVGIGAWFWLTEDLPKVEKLTDYRPRAVTQVLAADGSLMAEYFIERRYLTPLQHIPRHTIHAFVAAEDGNFFSHAGLDYLGIIRAAWANFRAGRVVQGGSTITQQVARGLLLSPHRTYVRKLREMILAYRIERSLTKDEILYLYLNQIYLGHGAYGVESAALTYYGKKAKDLDLAESALLAGLVQAPSRYSPIRHPRRARTRQVYVINRLVADGRITQAQANSAMNEALDIKSYRLPTVDAPYYAETVRQWLEEKYGHKTLYEDGLTVRTACAPRLTKQAYQAIDKGLAALTRRQGFDGPIATLTPAELAGISAAPKARTGLKAGDVVRAVMVEVKEKRKLYLFRMGSESGQASFESLAWARRMPPKKLDEKAGWRAPDKVLALGDVVNVRLSEFDRAAKAWQVELAVSPRAQSAILAIETGTGRVRVAVGGRDFAQSQFNRALQASRQPGSAFKPFIYAAALDHQPQVYTPVTTILDAPVVFDDPAEEGKKWKPKNYENKFFGPTTLRVGLEHSRNVVAVRLLHDIGVRYAVDYAARFGFESPLPPNLSLALGSAGLTLYEMTKAYSVFVNQGMLVEPVMVESVSDRLGKVIYQAKSSERQVISPETAFLVTHLLRGVVESGTGRAMKALNRPVAGKTGTTNDLRDAWFIGFAPQLVCGAWVGQDNNLPLGPRETGARAAGPIWLEFMKGAMQGLPAKDFAAPPGVVFARVDHETGRLTPPGAPGGFFEAFRKGSEPKPGDKPDAPTMPSGGGFLEEQTFGNGQ